MIEEVEVRIDGAKVGNLISRGESSRDKEIYFVYSNEWLLNGFNLSPLTMGFDAHPQKARDIFIFNGLHGAFYDSLPDGWGLLLMDRYFRENFDMNPTQITPLDRLSYMGSRAMGALEYYPAASEVELEDRVVDLSSLYKETVIVQDGLTHDVTKSLYILGGSPGGARPKVTIAISKDFRNATNAFQNVPNDYDNWLVKFRGKYESKDVGAIEYAFALMAKKAGVCMSDTELISVGDERFFATKRFDRKGSKKIHMMSVSGLLYADFRMPCMDYSELLKLTWRLTKKAEEVEKMARLMIFNAVIHNHDDHVKNFAFLYDDFNEWTLCPAFDVTFSPLPREHATAFNGAGIPNRQNIEKICSEFPFLDAATYIEQTLNALSGKGSIFKSLNIDKVESTEIFRRIDQVIENGDFGSYVK